MKIKRCGNKGCRRTEELLPLSEFYESKGKTNSWCKECCKAATKKRYENKKDDPEFKAKCNALSIKFFKEHPDYIPPCRTENPDYIPPCARDNPDYFNNWTRNKRKTDPMYKLNHYMSSGISKSLIGDKNGPWLSLVPYALQQLKKHLEDLFLPGMTWKNYGEWHIDHIIPVSLWEFKIAEEKEFKQCWALCNLQPLWETDNLKKGSKC